MHSRIAQDFANYRTQSETATCEELNRQLEKMFLDISGSVAQLITQDYLLNKNGKPVQAKDVVNVSSAIVRTLLRHGMETVGKVGEETQFNLNLHEPISVDEEISANETVTIRMVGIAFKGKDSAPCVSFKIDANVSNRRRNNGRKTWNRLWDFKYRRHTLEPDPR